MNMAINANTTDTKNITQKIAKAVRVATVAPIVALVLLTILWKTGVGGIIDSIADYVASVIFLSVLPILSYPLQRFIPGFKDGGREGQRNLAMVASVIGYIGGVAYALVFKAGDTMLALFLTYLGSVVGLLIFNKLFKFKASGHGCGLVGPMTVLTYYFGLAPFVIGVVLFTAVIWSSLIMKRHTLPQLLVGAVIPMLLFLVFINVI